MGLSLRAYARHRGVSDSTVRKAIKTGRITAEDDGTVDPERADQDWARNTRSRPFSGRTVDIDTDGDSALEPTHTASNDSAYTKARLTNELLKAQLQRLNLQERKGKLVDRAKAMVCIAHLARENRDAWLTWPSRIAAQLAAELGVDTHTLHTALEQYVDQQLRELGEFEPRID